MYPNSGGTYAGNGYLGNPMQGGCNAESNQLKQAIDVKRQTVHDALDNSEHQAGELHGVISALEERLACVLEPMQAPPTADGPSPNSPNVLDRIIRQRLVTAAACSRLQDILRRIQL